MHLTVWAFGSAHIRSAIWVLTGWAVRRHSSGRPRDTHSHAPPWRTARGVLECTSPGALGHRMQVNLHVTLPPGAPAPTPTRMIKMPPRARMQPPAHTPTRGSLSRARARARSLAPPTPMSAETPRCTRLTNHPYTPTAASGGAPSSRRRSRASAAAQEGSARHPAAAQGIAQPLSRSPAPQS